MIGAFRRCGQDLERFVHEKHPGVLLFIDWDLRKGSIMAWPSPCLEEVDPDPTS